MKLPSNNTKTNKQNHFSHGNKKVENVKEGGDGDEDDDDGELTLTLVNTSVLDHSTTSYSFAVTKVCFSG